MKKINISITGALGRMGRILIKKILEDKKFKLTSAIDTKFKNKNIFNGIKIQNNSIEAFKKADIIIDFSEPKGSMQTLSYAKKLKKKIIIGTTGFTKKQEKLIKNYSKYIAIFKSGNMSLGINLLQYIVKILLSR